MMQDKLSENWYLPYMNKKTNGEEVEEKNAPVAVFYCAGASNVGQASMKACVEAAKMVGYDKMALLCLASIPAGLQNIHNGANNAKGIVAVDGCPMQCAAKTLKKYNFELQKEVVLTRDICSNFCKHGVYTQQDGKPFVANPEGCIHGCRGCQSKCPVGAISYAGDDGQTGGCNCGSCCN